jgi:branched-chain amino acid transport system substrate-binding protein
LGLVQVLVRSVFAGILLLSASFARAETLVVAAPFTEFPELASQMMDGATAALAENWVAKPVDAGCTDASGSTIGSLILAEKPDAVIGLPCIESLLPVLKVLGPIGVPVITIGSRADAPSKLAVENKWAFYRIGPREHEEGEAIAKLIIEVWRDKPFAILDDGTIFARDTAEAIRNAAEITGIKPVLVDGFEPQIESQRKLINRLLASGATHVFIASDRANVAQIATEATGSNLTIAGPETLRASDLDYPLPSGVLMAARDVALKPDTLSKINDERKTPFAVAEGYTADAYVATEIALALKANPALRTFNTASGDVAAGADGFIDPVNYALFRFDGTVFLKVAP